MSAEDASDHLNEAPAQQDVSMELETEEESSQPPENDSNEAEAAKKSRIQKEVFLEMFRIAPRIKDVLPDLKVFMDHPDVIEWDRREVEHLVELRIQEEKAKKKAERAAAKREKELAAKQQPVDLANVIKSATGINIAGLFQEPAVPAPSALAPGALVPGAILPVPVIPPGAVVVHGRPEGIIPAAASSRSAPIIVTRLAPPPPKIVSVGHGKCGFDTPHPNEIPEELRHAKPDMIAPIPDELRVLPSRGPQIPPIPNELLPLEQRVFESLPIVFVRPPMRKTLYLAGARFGKRSERIKEEKKEEGKRKNKKRKAEDFQDSPDGKKNRGGFQKPHKPMSTGMNALPAGLNKNSPLAVKRYHARQLAKETGISLEDAMKEIEEQCNEFGGEDTPEAREHDERAMEMIRKRGEELWNQRYNYTPADHSKGIPGVDRPPPGRKDREPRGGPRDEPIPGVDRPPGSYPRNEPIPGVDRPPGGYPRDKPIPGIDRPPGGDPWKRRNRGGVKERERKKRIAEEMSRGGGHGRGGGGRGGYGGYDDRGGYGGGGRYDSYNDYGARDQQHRYAGGGYEAYDDRRGYEDYYGGQEGYENYDQYEGGYGGQQGGNYEYDQHSAEGYYQQHGGQDSTYYQEDGSQYYNEYYGTAAQEQPSGAEYQATFDSENPPTSSSSPPPA